MYIVSMTADLIGRDCHFVVVDMRAVHNDDNDDFNLGVVVNIDREVISLEYLKRREEEAPTTPFIDNFCNRSLLSIYQSTTTFVYFYFPTIILFHLSAHSFIGQQIGDRTH